MIYLFFIITKNIVTKNIVIKIRCKITKNIYLVLCTICLSLTRAYAYALRVPYIIYWGPRHNL